MVQDYLSTTFKIKSVYTFKNISSWCQSGPFWLVQVDILTGTNCGCIVQDDNGMDGTCGCRYCQILLDGVELIQYALGLEDVRVI